MTARAKPRRKNPATGYYFPNTVPMSAIRRFARQIAERFQPDKIILFGSYAYGKPTKDSDVDLLVVMPTKDPTAQAARIRLAFQTGFPVDLLVRTPTVVERRIRWEDWFMRVFLP